jgi:RNA polymerase sigma-70 factor (ECF subfamily)
MTEIERVFREYAPSVTYFFMRRGFSIEECSDLTQETFLKAWSGLGGFRRDSAIETWLIQIATNVWKNHLRASGAIKRSVRTVPLDEAVGQGEGVARSPRPGGRRLSESPQDQLLEQERGRLLREAVDELPRRMRRCVLLRIDQGLKYREIASIMRVSIDTVKTQLYQARHRLKERLQEYFDLEEAAGE